MAQEEIIQAAAVYLANHAYKGLVYGCALVAHALAMAAIVDDINHERS